MTLRPRQVRIHHYWSSRLIEVMQAHPDVDVLYFRYPFSGREVSLSTTKFVDDVSHKVAAPPSLLGIQPDN